MTIKYVRGDATQPEGEDHRIIVHCCNNRGMWGAGFTGALSKRWPEPESEYRKWARGFNPLPLGAVQFVAVELNLTVANLVGQDGIRRPEEPTPIRYEAIRDGLYRVSHFAELKGASIHMPRIGCGLAGGTWDKIEPIIEQQLGGHFVTVYEWAGW